MASSAVYVRTRLIGAIAIAALSALIRFTAAAATPAPKYFKYRIVHSYPHDPNAFTEGIELRNGFIYESTGLYGKSMLLKENLKTGVALKQVKVSSSVFGEGITLIQGRLVQVTWQSQLGFVYDPETLLQTGTFHYSGEGWGMTNDGHTIYLSDGTPTIRCLDPKTFAVTRSFMVHDGDEEITMVNELEWVKGQIFANIWHADRIARIDPVSGLVTAWIDITGLRPKEATSEEAVANGIAFDSATDHLLVTGKLWPKLFEIALEPKRLPASGRQAKLAPRD